jgi:hypothetical protein
MPPWSLKSASIQPIFWHFKPQMDFGILTVFWYFGPLQFQNENASILLMKSAPRSTKSSAFVRPAR